MLRLLREKRQLSAREVAKLADVDHAYIHRLETGEKDSPSPDVIEKLIRALRPGKRETDMLRYLANHPDIDPVLVKHVLEDGSVTSDLFTAVAGSVYRGAGRVDYGIRIERMRSILDDDDQ